MDDVRTGAGPGLAAPRTPRTAGTPAGIGTAGAEPFRPADLVIPAIIVLLLFAGFFKDNPLLAWLPVDLTLFAFAGSAVCLVGVALTQRSALRVPLGALALAVAFVPGILLASDNAYATEKVPRLAITAVAALAPLYLVTTARRQAVWVWLHVLVGAVLALGELLTPSQETIRVALEGTNTIETGRASGVAVVALVIIAVGLPRWRLPLLLAAACIAYFVIASGSRGPALAVAAALALVVLTVPARRRIGRLLLITGVVAGLWLFMLTSDLSGAERIRDSIYGGAPVSQIRVLIWNDALAAIPHVPAGVGWGDFWSVLHPGARHTTTYVQYAHNLILETFVEGGWIAGVAVIVFIVLSLARLRRIGGTYGSALYGIAVFFVVNAMVSSDVNGNRTMWAALAIGWVAVSARDAGSTGDRGRPRPAPSTGRSVA